MSPERDFAPGEMRVFGLSAEDPPSSTPPRPGVDDFDPFDFIDDPASPPRIAGFDSPSEGSFDSDTDSLSEVESDFVLGSPTSDLEPGSPSWLEPRGDPFLVPPPASPRERSPAHPRELGPPRAARPLVVRRRPSPAPSHWADFGLDARPAWWHYYEQRNPPAASPDAPPPDDSEAVEAARNAASQEAHFEPPDDQPFLDDADGVEPEPEDPLEADFGRPELPPGDADSETWRVYHASMRAWRLEEAHRLSQAAPDAAAEDFHSPPLRDGAWNHSSHVSKLIRDGFDISVDTTKRGKRPPPLRCTSQREANYIRQMVADGVLEEGDVEFSVPHFWLYKPGKLRLIFNGKRLNSAVAKPPPFNMKGHPTLQRFASKNLWHASDDLKNMFFSVKLAPRARRFFGIRTSIGTFRYTALPFGFSWSPFIAHVTVDEICKRALEAGYQVTHYLDDFNYFGKTQEEATAARDFVRGLFSDAGWRLNPSKVVPPAQRFIALGLEYDLVTKRVRVPPKSLKMLRENAVKFLETPHFVSRKVLAHFVGSVVWFNWAYPGILATLSPAIAFLNAHQFDWRRHHSFKSFFPFFQTALEAAETAGWCPLQVFSKPPEHIFTDATPTHLGITFRQGFASAAIRPTTVYKAEALAIQWLLRFPLPKAFVIRCDNMALCHALKKGRSRIPEANMVAKALLKLRLRGHKIAVKWVPTHRNPADAPSRMPLEFFVSPRFASGQAAIAA